MHVLMRCGRRGGRAGIPDFAHFPAKKTFRARSRGRRAADPPTLRHKCGTSAAQVRNMCGTSAEQVRKKCETSAEQVRSKCGASAEQVRNKCGGQFRCRLMVPVGWPDCGQPPRGGGRRLGRRGRKPSLHTRVVIKRKLSSLSRAAGTGGGGGCTPNAANERNAGDDDESNINPPTPCQ